jgi:hypothetical protein
VLQISVFESPFAPATVTSIICPAMASRVAVPL